MNPKEVLPECFVISPIGSPESPTRIKSDQVLRHIIRPCIEELGFRVVRADEMKSPGMITTQIITKLLNAPLVVADLSEHNPNVFYELAIRHAKRKPVIHIIDESDRIPFDVANFRTIQYNLKNPDSVANCKLELADHVREILANPLSVDNPIITTLLIEQLPTSGNPLEIANAKLMRNIENLDKLVRIIDARLGFSGHRGRLVDEVAQSLRRMRMLIDEAISDGIDEESEETLRTALDLHVSSVAQLLRSLGVDERSAILGSTKD
jgi:uncharacterized protein YllA (UPF0747 family)